jgi:hypothetical protein
MARGREPVPELGRMPYLTRGRGLSAPARGLRLMSPRRSPGQEQSRVLGSARVAWSRAAFPVSPPHSQARTRERGREQAQARWRQFSPPPGKPGCLALAGAGRFLSAAGDRFRHRSASLIPRAEASRVQRCRPPGRARARPSSPCWRPRAAAVSVPSCGHDRRGFRPCLPSRSGQWQAPGPGLAAVRSAAAGLFATTTDS